MSSTKTKKFISIFRKKAEKGRIEGEGFGFGNFSVLLRVG